MISVSVPIRQVFSMKRIICNGGKLRKQENKKPKI